MDDSTVSTAMIDDEEQPVEVGDETPKLEEQARLNGWKSGIFNFGKAEEPGVELFNPGLVRRPDGLWLLVRRSVLTPGMPYGKNGIWACRLKEDRTPQGGPLLQFPDSMPEEQMEDPRAVYWNGQTWVGCVNFTWFSDGSWTGAHQMLGVFGDDLEWTPIARRDPPVETNKGMAGFTEGNHQKNWLWFFVDGKLHLLYMSDPWRVIEFGQHWNEQKGYRGEGVKWKYGLVRGGTPPVQVGDHFITFFHSSLPWRGRYRRYYMGAIAFEAKPPFRPTLWTQEPLLIGSQNDPWHQRKPLVVFPCGAVLENDKWLVSYGINDLKSGWVEIPHEDIQKLLQPIPVAPATLLLSESTFKPVFESVPFAAEGVEVTSQPEPGRNPVSPLIDPEIPLLGASRRSSREETLASGGADNGAANNFSEKGGETNGQEEKQIQGEIRKAGDALLSESASDVQSVGAGDTPTIDEILRLRKLRTQAAKAREALAAKRATGWRPKKRRMKRRKAKRPQQVAQENN